MRIRTIQAPPANLVKATITRVTPVAAALEAQVPAPESAQPPRVEAAPIEPVRRPAVPAPAEKPRPEPPSPPEPRPAPPKPAVRALDIPPNAAFNGELLRRVREARVIGLRQLSERTKIAYSHLENIEADHYKALPPAVYLRGFLMLIARELKLDPLKVSKTFLDLAAGSKAAKT